MTKNEALKRARRGAAMLDAKLGTGWRRKIRRRRLDMSSGWVHPRQSECGCVLAQLDYTLTKGEGLWYRTLQRLGAVVWDMETHGFTANTDEDYKLLDAAWLQVLREGPAT